MGQCHISKRSKQKSKSRARSHKKVPYLNDQEWLKIFSYLEDKEDMKSALMKCWRWFTLEFPTGRDSATFRDKGTEISSLSRDKGTTGQAQNFATGRDGTGFWQLVPSRPGTSRGTETKEKTLIKWNFFLWFPVSEHLFLFWNVLFCFRTSFSCFRTSFSCFGMSFSCFGTSFSCFFVPLGRLFCPGTGRDRGVCPVIFAPALVPGQRDTGTGIFFCPGTKGQRDVPGRPVPWKP